MPFPLLRLQNKPILNAIRLHTTLRSFLFHKEKEFILFFQKNRRVDGCEKFLA